MSVETTEVATAGSSSQPDDLAAAVRDLVAELRRGRRVESAELLPAPAAAALCGLGASTWARLTAAAKVPAPVRVNAAVRWRKSELLEWIAAGCPTREVWETMRAAKGNSRK